jgi:ethanolamine ammonia-lyase small subunit
MKLTDWLPFKEKKRLRALATARQARWRAGKRHRAEAEREALEQQHRDRARASWKALEGAIIGHILTLLIASPPAVSRALLAWDAPPGYL